MLYFRRLGLRMGGEHRRRWVMYRANQDVGSDLLTLANSEAIAVQRKYKSASAQQAADLPGVAPSIQCNTCSGRSTPH